MVVVLFVIFYPFIARLKKCTLCCCEDGQRSLSGCDYSPHESEEDVGTSKKLLRNKGCWGCCNCFAGTCFALDEERPPKFRFILLAPVILALLSSYLSYGTCKAWNTSSGPVAEWNYWTYALVKLMLIYLVVIVAFLNGCSAYHKEEIEAMEIDDFDLNFWSTRIDPPFTQAGLSQRNGRVIWRSRPSSNVSESSSNGSESSSSGSESSSSGSESSNRLGHLQV